MGRYRPLPDINSRNKWKAGHMCRAAINTPIQGGAADIVMMAMLKIEKDERLRRLGYRMLLQIHDGRLMELKRNDDRMMSGETGINTVEVILEGPKENVEEAKKYLVGKID